MKGVIPVVIRRSVSLIQSRDMLTRMFFLPLVLLGAYDNFPPETIHLVVVTRGRFQGADQPQLTASQHLFVAPDNGCSHSRQTATDYDAFEITTKICFYQNQHHIFMDAILCSSRRRVDWASSARNRKADFLSPTTARVIQASLPPDRIEHYPHRPFLVNCLPGYEPAVLPGRELAPKFRAAGWQSRDPTAKAFLSLRRLMTSTIPCQSGAASLSRNIADRNLQPPTGWD